MRPNELREKSDEELRGILLNLSEEFFNARFQHYNGQLENTQKLPILKKDIARVKTLLKERELKIEREIKAPLYTKDEKKVEESKESEDKV